MDLDFNWSPQPEAERLVADVLHTALTGNGTLRAFSERLLAETGTRLTDWLDHLVTSADAVPEQRLVEVGFQHLEDVDQLDAVVWGHPEGLFPKILIRDHPTSAVAIGVESVADFLAAHAGIQPLGIRGESGSDLRVASLCVENGIEFLAVERHGNQGFVPQNDVAGLHERVSQHACALRNRRRDWPDPLAAFDHTDGLIRAAQSDLGVARAADLFFETERAYWENRNRAARIQKRRQDRLGLGWANHDHHTYRSSRQYFWRLIQSLEALGCVCRERFYAGQSAGWGAQVLEHPDCGVVIFADLDLTGDELNQDFAHEPLAKTDALHTVGLWCGLHGEAFLEAGMHHLECQFDFNAARDQLVDCDVQMLHPFTDWSYLKQAFTQGETWAVREERLQGLMEAGLITEQQSESFAEHGAVGSHLELLQRDQGYKGFNQSGVSDIIRKTDPRK